MRDEGNVPAALLCAIKTTSSNAVHFIIFIVLHNLVPFIPITIKCKVPSWCPCLFRTTPPSPPCQTHPSDPARISQAHLLMLGGMRKLPHLLCHSTALHVLERIDLPSQLLTLAVP